LKEKNREHNNPRNIAQTSGYGKAHPFGRSFLSAAMRTAREPMRTAAERKDCPKGRALGNKKVNQQKLGSCVEIKNLAKSISF
jgi:hypothetical protein